MLTQKHKEMRVQWALQHKDDDWSRTVFSDETSYQLFRNTIHRWSKNAKAELKRIPKNRQKIMVWGGFSRKGPLSCHSEEELWMAPTTLKFFKNIFSLVQDGSLDDGGGSSKTMIRSIPAR
jgi:hypothetical protein